MNDLLDYVQDSPLFDSVSTDDRDFLLVHSGFENFDPDKPLSAYEPDDLLWHRPQPDERYYDDMITILGHTPTFFYGCPGKMYVTDTWIDIDTGAASGGAPMLLRLDDMKAFYAD